MAELGASLACHTSRKTKSIRVSPALAGGGSSVIRFQVETSSGEPGGVPVRVPVTGMSQPLTAAHVRDLASPARCLPNLNQLLRDGSASKTAEALLLPPSQPEGTCWRIAILRASPWICWLKQSSASSGGLSACQMTMAN